MQVNTFQKLEVILMVKALPFFLDAMKDSLGDNFLHPHTYERFSYMIVSGIEKAFIHFANDVTTFEMMYP